MQMYCDKHMEAFYLGTLTSSSWAFLSFPLCSVICHNETEFQSAASRPCKWHSLTQVSRLTFYKLPLQGRRHHLYATGLRWMSCDINPTIFLLSHFDFIKQVLFSFGKAKGFIRAQNMNSPKMMFLYFFVNMLKYFFCLSWTWCTYPECFFICIWDSYILMNCCLKPSTLMISVMYSYTSVQKINLFPRHFLPLLFLTSCALVFFPSIEVIHSFTAVIAYVQFYRQQIVLVL